jgi:pimeloyl-ACP methyl ester carboxylesterase
MVDRRIDLGDVELMVSEAGVGGHPLMLVHGWTGSRTDFTDWMDPLADLHQHVVAPDNRGHGHSAKPIAEHDYSLDIMAGDVLALADALAWDSFVLLGHSMGGMVAQKAALRAPDRMNGLILMDTHHGPIDVAPAIVEAGIEAARHSGTGVIADMMAAASEPGPLDTEAYRRVCAERPGHFERGTENTRASSPAMFAAMLAEMAATPSRLDDLAGLNVPTLVLVGDQDEPFLDAAHRLAEVMPQARLEVLADGGHSPQFEAPEAWWKAMSTFLGEVHA